MNETKEFKSVFKKQLTAFYHDHRATRGTSVSLLENLHIFDNYLVRIGFCKQYFKEEDYEAWIKTMPHNKPITINRKTMAVRKFLLYMCSLGIECYVPKPVKSPDCDFVPYIFSRDEVWKLFQAADRLRTAVRNKDTILMAFPVLLRILYSTGMRIGECLKIKNRDVDFERHIINIDRENAKNGCQRIAVMRESLESSIRQYLRYRDLLPYEGLGNPERPLIVSGLGKPPSQQSFQKWFVSALKLAGIPYRGNHQGPSIHCLRHSACVHALAKMVGAGKDSYVVLPILSAYMGHKNVSGTEHYIRLTQEMYPDIMKKDIQVTSGLEYVVSHVIVNQDDEY